MNDIAKAAQNMIPKQLLTVSLSTLILNNLAIITYIAQTKTTIKTAPNIDPQKCPPMIDIINLSAKI